MPGGLLIAVLVVIAVFLATALWRALRQWLQPDRAGKRPDPKA